MYLMSPVSLQCRKLLRKKRKAFQTFDWYVINRREMLMCWVPCRKPELCCVCWMLCVSGRKCDSTLVLLRRWRMWWRMWWRAFSRPTVRRSCWAGFVRTRDSILRWVPPPPSLHSGSHTHTRKSALKITGSENGTFYENVVKLSKKNNFQNDFWFSSSERSLLESSWEWLEFYILIHLIKRNWTI